jgi:hypothetical protein
MLQLPDHAIDPRPANACCTSEAADRLASRKLANFQPAQGQQSPSDEHPGWD